MKWEHSGFNVGWKERKIEAGDRKNLEGLLTYMERPAVSLRRLRYREDGMVHYQGTRFHPRLGIDHQILPPIEFLALLVPHVALKYEVTIRLYGAISTTFRRKAGLIQDPPVHEPPPEPVLLTVDGEIPQGTAAGIEPLRPSPVLPPKRPSAPPPECPRDAEEDSHFIRKRKRSWAKLIQKAWLEDPSLCRSCQKPMKIIAAIQKDQADVIERILRCVHLWDPPWKKARRSRGPPTPVPGEAAGRGPPGAPSRRPHQGPEESEEWPEAIDPPHHDLDFDSSPRDDDGDDGMG